MLLILLWHFVSYPLFAGPLRAADHPLISGVLGWLWSGVDLFFILSGYLIGGILLEHRNCPNYFQVFYLRRSARTFPLYAVSLILFAVMSWLITGPAFKFSLTVFGNSDPIAWLFASPLPLWSYCVFIQNILMAVGDTFGSNWLGITWSLAIEEQFYLVLPILIRFTPMRLLPFVLLGGCLLAMGLRMYVPTSFAFMLMPCRMDSLFLGVLIAYLGRIPSFREGIRRRQVFLSAVFVVLVLAGPMWFDSNPLNPINKGWLALLWASFLVVALSGNAVLLRVLRMAWLVRLGLVSYGVYLFHQPVNGLVHGILRQHTPYQIVGTADLLYSIGALGLTLMLASLLYHGIERPFIGLGHRLSYTDLPQPNRADDVFGDVMALSPIPISDKGVAPQDP
jgi:peptidoglycan/LPS O-acetylase OafA/YrhL